MDNEKYKIQPLRIPTGWEIVYNSFTEYDLSIHGEDDITELDEDLLQLFNKRCGLTIDLGWYPSFSTDGFYHLYLIKNSDWEKPLKELTTKSRKAVIEAIEKWAELSEGET